MSRQWPPPPGRVLPSPISVELDNDIKLIIETKYQFVSDFNTGKTTAVNWSSWFFFWFFLHDYSDLRFLLSSPLIKPDIFSQTRSSWILAGWLNGTAQQKEDLSLIQGTRLALKEPRNQDHKTGSGSPMLFSQRYYSPF